jgi:hypothetical protein
VFQSVCELNLVAKRAREVRDVRDPDMFRLGGSHVWQPSLEPGLDTRHVQCLALTQVLAEESDMSGLEVGHV